MYDIGTRVVVTAKGSGYEGVVGHISERHWTHDPYENKRRAVYLVQYGGYGKPIQDIMLGSKFLKPAEVCCDACGKWRRWSQVKTQRENPWEDYQLAICWLCERTK